MFTQRAVILLTGFGPFPGVPENVSSALVPKLAAEARRRWPSFHFETALLPTEWQSAPALVERQLKELKPAIALHFGVSSKAQGFVIELRGHNLARPLTDAAGLTPHSERLAADGPDLLAARIPVFHIVRRLRQLSLPVSLSRDAGGYLCNAVLFTSLMEAKRADWLMRSGFVHLPTAFADTAQEASSLTRQQAIEGSLEILSVSLDRFDPVSKPGILERIQPA